MERPITIAVRRNRQKTAAEEEAIAAVQGGDVTDVDGQEGEGGVDEGYSFPGDVGDVVSREWETPTVKALVEESDQGVR